jgi:hypothetical protein
MTEIKLDPKKLLGFKIAINSESAATLRSPKIGAKTDVTNADAEVGTHMAPPQAKVKTT